MSVSKDVLTQNYAQAVLDLVNKERVKRGVNPLVLSEDICQKADIRAKELTVLNSLVVLLKLENLVNSLIFVQMVKLK